MNTAQETDAVTVSFCHDPDPNLADILHPANRERDHYRDRQNSPAAACRQTSLLTLAAVHPEVTRLTDAAHHRVVPLIVSCALLLPTCAGAPPQAYCRTKQRDDTGKRIQFPRTCAAIA
jgi:hypothetical protein